MKFSIDKIFSNLSRHRDLLPYGMIVLVSLVIYSAGYSNDFLSNWDDPQYITANPNIQSITLQNLRSIFTSFSIGTYAPLHLLSYMLDYFLWGPNYLGFLFINVTLHTLNAILFYKILCRFKFAPGWALLAALLFTAHPVQVESVAWISQRKNILSMTFYLGAFWQYLSYTEKKEKFLSHYLLSLSFFLLALLTKSVVVILPAMLLAYDLLLRERWRSSVVIAAEKIPFIVMGLAASWLSMISQRAEYGGGGKAEVLGGSTATAAMTMLTAFKRYLGNLFWPLQLSAEYQVDIKKVFDIDLLCSIVLLAATLATVFLVPQKSRRVALFWLSVFFIGFIPVSQIVPFMHLMNDRYLYFPMLGFSAGLMVVLSNCTDRFPKLFKPTQLGLIFVLLLLSILSWQRTRVWANSLTLWRDAVRNEPASANAWACLGNTYGMIGNLPEAIASYQKALTLNNSDYQTHYYFGMLYFNIGDVTSAIRHLRKAVELKPDSDIALYNLGYAYMLDGQYQAAIDSLQHMLQFKNENPEILMLIGASYYGSGDLENAWRVYTQIRSSSHPGLSVIATGMQSLVAYRQGILPESQRLWQEALAAGMAETDIYLNWARLEAISKHREEMLQFLSKSLASGKRDLSSFVDDPNFRNFRDDPEFLAMFRQQ